MRGRKKLFILVPLLSALLIVSVVFSSGVIDVLTFSLGGSSASSAGAPESSSPEVFVDPVMTRGDYAPGYQISDTFQVGVNITGVTDLFAWQINMTWNTSILSLSSIIAGEFLHAGMYDTTSSPAPDGLGFVINKTDNAEGYTAIGESILGGNPLPGVSGDGRLVSIEFLIVGYGDTNLTIDVDGTMNTTLLDNSVPAVIITYDKTDGYFSNMILGDICGDTSGTPPDGDVDRYDFGFFAGAYGTSVGHPNFNPLADVTGDTTGSYPDGDIDRYDFGVFAGNYGRTI
jgi:hypothetical protein